MKRPDRFSDVWCACATSLVDGWTVCDPAIIPAMPSDARCLPDVELGALADVILAGFARRAKVPPSEPTAAGRASPADR